MPSTAQAHMEQHYKKQFIMEMQGKGKLPRFPTDASERKAAVCDHTVKRIFPPSFGGLDGAIASMLDNAQANVAMATRVDPLAPSGTTRSWTLPTPEAAKEGAGSLAGSTASAQGVTRATEKAVQRQALKDKMAQMESDLHEARTARVAMQEELATLRLSLNA